MQILGNEMAARTPGVPPPTFPPPGSLVTYECEGYLTVYDNSLGEDVPIPNLKMSYQVGSSIVNAVPDNTGYFRFVYRDFRMFASDSIVLPITFTYQDPQGKWKITESQTTSAPLTVDKLITFARPSLQHFTGNIKLYMGDRQENAIHRAANYFFNNQTYFPSLYSDALKIIANDATVSSGNAGLFTYDSFGCWINIYHHNHNAGVVIGTTLHELGHFAHFKPLGYSRFINIPKLLQESFASYSGWYLGEEYYVSQGATRPSSGYWTIAGDNHRQYWHENYAPSSILKYYSPLFIDLTDIYNQKTTTTSVYPNDAIQGVPASKIWDIVSVGTTWPLCRSGLQSMVGTYYTSTAFNNWIIQFDNWFNNPANQ